MADDRELRSYRRNGVLIMVIGFVVSIGGAIFAHFTGLSPTDDLGRELYPAIPRGWPLVLIGQIISLTGGFVLMMGIALAFIHKRPMTWARASVAAALFTMLTMILFGIIPNEWLTLTQAEWEWTPTRIALTVPPALVMNNDITISYAALKDIVSGTYSVIALVAVAIGMSRWQTRQMETASAPPPQKMSEYGRPLTKVEG